MPLVLKCDVQGSQEALSEMLIKLSTDKVKVRILHSSVGAITETDVLLAAASNAIIIGFNVRPERKAAELANREKVDIRLHTIIYNVVDEIKRAMIGMLEPIIKETYLGTAEVRNTFRVPKVGVIAGSLRHGRQDHPHAEVRLLRDNVVIYRRKDRIAEAVQGRRVRSGARLRVRYRYPEFQRRQGRRHHRSVHHGKRDGRRRLETGNWRGAF